MLVHPDLDGGIAPDRTGKPHQFAHGSYGPLAIAGLEFSSLAQCRRCRKFMGLSCAGAATRASGDDLSLIRAPARADCRVLTSSQHLRGDEVPALGHLRFP